MVESQWVMPPKVECVPHLEVAHQTEDNPFSCQGWMTAMQLATFKMVSTKDTYLV
jgi:hypothetical protein